MTLQHSQPSLLDLHLQLAEPVQPATAVTNVDTAMVSPQLGYFEWHGRHLTKELAQDLVVAIDVQGTSSGAR